MRDFTAFGELVAELGVLSSLAGPFTLGSQPVALLAAASSAVHVFARRSRRSGALAWMCDPLVKYLLALALFALDLPLLALALWIGSGLASALRAASGLRLSQPAGEAFPRLKVEAGRTELLLRRAAVSGFKLVVVLIVLSQLQSCLGDIQLVRLDWLSVSVSDIVPLLALVFTVYYGYRVLVGAKVLLDAVTLRLAKALRITESVAKHIGLDALYLAVAWLALTLVPPSLRPVPVVGEALSRAVALALLVVVLILLYDLAKVVYVTFEDAFKHLVRRIAEAVSEGGA